MERNQMVNKIIEIVKNRTPGEEFVLRKEEADNILSDIEEHMMPRRRDHKDHEGNPTYSFTWGEDE